MARGTARQRERAKANPRMGQCRIPHCRTLQPAKNMYGWMCWFHFRMIYHWGKRTGFSLESAGPILSAEAYCDWLRQRAQRIWDGAFSTSP